MLPAAFLKVLGDGRSFSAEETFVLAAMRRASRDLEDAPVDEIAEHGRSMTDDR